jgi:hypothetical protein
VEGVDAEIIGAFFGEAYWVSCEEEVDEAVNEGHVEGY